MEARASRLAPFVPGMGRVAQDVGTFNSAFHFSSTSMQQAPCTHALTLPSLSRTAASAPLSHKAPHVVGPEVVHGQVLLLNASVVAEGTQAHISGVWAPNRRNRKRSCRAPLQMA